MLWSIYNIRPFNVLEITTVQRDVYTIGCLLFYPYFNDHYKMVVIDLCKQQVLDADSKTIQKINFSANLDRVGNTTIFLIIKEVKEIILDFSQGTMRVL